MLNTHAAMATMMKQSASSVAKLGALHRSTHPIAPKTLRSVSLMSTLSDSIADLLRSQKGKQRDELDSRNFKITRLNDSLVAARAALLDSVVGPAAGDEARQAARRKRVEYAWRDLLGRVPDGDKRDGVAKALNKYEKKEKERREELRNALDSWWGKQVAASKSADKKKKEGEDSFFQNILSWFGRRRKKTTPQKLLAQQLDNEAELLKDLAKYDVNVETARKVFRGASMMDMNDVKNGGKFDETAETAATERSDTKYVYVLDFKGDTRATKVAHLAEEISALLSLPKELAPTEVLVRLKSQGGSVTGYGLGGAELGRIRKAGITLTVCVDEVSASGGYLMSCVADRICASPFAAIGSIGVIASTPNVAKRLGEEGVSVIQKTGGKYKRTVTPWKEPEPEEMEKLQEDVNTIHSHFIQHVLRYRSRHISSIEEVATGEVWYGEDALSRGLVDDLLTSEEYIQNRIADGCELLHVQKIPKRTELPWWASTELNGLSPEGSDLWSEPMLQYRKLPGMVHDADIEASHNLYHDITGSLSNHESKKSLARAISKALTGSNGH